MKKNICVLDEDLGYSKKFCNKSIKVYGDKYVFLYFSNFEGLLKFVDENNVSAVVLSEFFIEKHNEINVDRIYILTESKNEIKNGKFQYINKIQNINNILEKIDLDLEEKNKRNNSENNIKTKIISLYSPYYIEDKKEICIKLARQINKKNNVLVIDFDEFDNYKKTVGLSNIIYAFKQDNLNKNLLNKELMFDKDVKIINSVAYPEDLSIMSNVELSNMINQFRDFEYDYIFLNLDNSFSRNQYIFTESDYIIIYKNDNKLSKNIDIFKSYLRLENNIDMKKVTEFTIEKNAKNPYLKFIKEMLDESK